MGTTIPDTGPLATADADDALLVARTGRGDRSAFDELFRRHAHAAWRVALAVGGSRAAAAQAVAEGFTAALKVRAGGPGHGLAFRLLAVRAAFEAAMAEAAGGVGPAPDVAANATIGALQGLPVRSRAVLWLLVAESGSATQVATVLSLDADDVTRIGRRALTSVTHQARTTDAEVPAALRALVTPMPTELGATAAAWWTAWQTEEETAQRRRIGAALTVAPLTERIVGTAAVAVLAAGVAAAFALGDRGTRPAQVALAGTGELAGAAPGSTDAAGATTASTTGAPTVPAAPTVPKPAPWGARSDAARSADAAAGGGGVSTVLPAGSSPALNPPSAVGPRTAPPQGPGAPPTSVVAAGVGANLGGLPVAAGAGTDGLGVQLGGTVIGTPPAAPATSGIVITTGVFPPIALPLP